MSAIAFTLAELPRLTKLTAYASKIGDQGTKALAAAASIGALSQIGMLSLRKNFIDDEGIIALAGACDMMPRLTTLAIRPNDFGTAGEAALESACATGRCPAFCDLVRSADSR